MKEAVLSKPRWRSVAVSYIPALISVLFASLYGYFQMQGIYGGDAGELVANAYTFGIPHAPGYSLYTFLAGCVIRIIPWGTVAWRVCFFSSLPTALALFFLWRLTFRLTKSVFASTIAAVMYGLSGPVWLNAITQEVFAFLSFFSNVFLERFVAWLEEKKQSQLLFLSFWSSLSLTAHYCAILYMIPAFFIVVSVKDLWEQIRNRWWKILLFFLVGFLSLVYFPIASLAGNPFDFEHASTWGGFLRIVLRISTGGFHAAAGLVPTLLERMMNVYSFFQFSLRDFGFPSIVLIIFGALHLRVTKRKVYDFFILCLFFWIFYLFYSGFPQLTNYHIGTIERFFIVPYQLIALFIAVGYARLLSGMIYLFRFIPYVKFILPVIFSCIIFIGEWSVWNTNIGAFKFLRSDRSMEQLGTDILKSAPQNSIIFLWQDTTVFAMNYSYYVLRMRPDIKLIKLPILSKPHYRDYIRRTYPDLYLPEESEAMSGAFVVSDFLSKNSVKYPIMSDEETEWIEGVTWVPRGLLFELIPTTDVRVDHALAALENRKLWQQFKPPLYLLRYQKQLPMLSDALRVYAHHRLMIVRQLVYADSEIAQILEELRQALAMEINFVPEDYLSPAIYLFENNRCGDAKEYINKIHSKWGDDRVILQTYHRWKSACGSDAVIDALDALFRKRFPQSVDSFTN